MLKIICGPPGSGKSYFAVREILLKNYEWSKQFGEWQSKPVTRDDQGRITFRPKVIFTNIDSLRLHHISIDHYCQHHNISIHQFFTVETADLINKEYGNYCVILDEAQKIFPSEYKDIYSGRDSNKSVFFFFEYHRHKGCDLYLICQRYDRIHRAISGLAEYYIHAVRKTFQVGNEMRYHLKDSHGDVFKTLAFPRDKRIFALYRSFDSGSEEVGRQPRPYRKLLIVFGILLLIPIFGGIYFYRNFSSGMRQSSLQSPSVATLPRPVPGQGGRGLPSAPPPLPRTRYDQRIAALSKTSAEPVKAKTDYVVVRSGGFSIAGIPVSIQILDRIYPVDGCPYTYTSVPDHPSLFDVFVPRDELVAYNRDRRGFDGGDDLPKSNDSIISQADVEANNRYRDRKSLGVHIVDKPRKRDF